MKTVKVELKDHFKGQTPSHLCATIVMKKGTWQETVAKHYAAQIVKEIT
jgi:hypothetical protein